jgi:hypothetical protein
MIVWNVNTALNIWQNTRQKHEYSCAKSNLSTTCWKFCGLLFSFLVMKMQDYLLNGFCFDKYGSFHERVMNVDVIQGIHNIQVLNILY